MQLLSLFGQLHKRIPRADVLLRPAGLLVLFALRPVPSERPARRPIPGLQFRDLFSASPETVRGQRLQRRLFGVRSAPPVLAEQLPPVPEPNQTVRAVQQGAKRGDHRQAFQQAALERRLSASKRDQSRELLKRLICPDSLLNVLFVDLL